MQRKSKELKVIEKAISPYGYKIVSTKRHRQIINAEGNKIYTLSASPSDGNFYKQVLRDLRVLGHIK